MFDLKRLLYVQLVLFSDRYKPFQMTSQDDVENQAVAQQGTQALKTGFRITTSLVSCTM